MVDTQPSHLWREKTLHRAFQVSLVLKGLNAFIELGLGVALLFTTRFNDLIATLSANELIEDPHDFLAQQAQHLMPYLSPHTEVFVGLYLIGHGVVNLFLVGGLLREKLWAFPVALGVLSLLIAYQVVRIAEQHSLILALFTFYDTGVVVLIFREYRARLLIGDKES